jgi:hypothetical protein
MHPWLLPRCDRTRATVTHGRLDGHGSAQPNGEVARGCSATAPALGMDCSRRHNRPAVAGDFTASSRPPPPRTGPRGVLLSPSWTPAPRRPFVRTRAVHARRRRGTEIGSSSVRSPAHLPAHGATLELPSENPTWQARGPSLEGPRRCRRRTEPCARVPGLYAPLAENRSRPSICVACGRWRTLSPARPPSGGAVTQEKCKSWCA